MHGSYNVKSVTPVNKFLNHDELSKYFKDLGLVTERQVFGSKFNIDQTGIHIIQKPFEISVPKDQTLVDVVLKKK
jgi:hypothetical protein